MSYYTTSGENVSQAAAGLGWTMRQYRRGAAGAEAVACEEDSLLFKYEKTAADPAMCTKKLKPLPVVAGIVGLVALGWFALRKSRRGR